MLNSWRLKYYTLKNILLFKLNKSVVFGSSLRIRGPFKLIIRKDANLKIGDSFSMSSGMMLNPLSRNIKSMIRIDDNANVIIGNNVGISSSCLWSKESITFGDNVKIGADCLFFDSDMHSLNYVNRRNPPADIKDAKSAPIIIGNDVFIGTRSIITKGITIGDCSIIASGSVVVKSVPPNEVWGGNPAKFIRKLNTI